jgi:murein L,D-transpeptidase YcbB/YkuD
VRHAAKSFLVLLIAAAVSGACSRLGDTGSTGTPVDAALRAELGSKARPVYVTADAEGARLWKLTRTFYERRGYELAWIEDEEPRPQMDDLLRAIRTADGEGLDPEAYGFTVLDGRRREASKGFLTKKGFEAGQAGRMEVWLTYIYMKYSSDLANGFSDLAHADPTWRIQPEQFDPLAHLEKALAENRIAESLHDLTPNAPQYRALRDALARYRKIAASGGWPALPRSLRVKPGQTNANVTALAQRLAASGDYQGKVAPQAPMQYGGELETAVKRFQQRHGLEPDGVIGPAVIAELNVPVERRIRQIELNLERWRWLPRDLGARHILVNIPAYRLEVWDKGTIPVTMRVVVGRKDTPTPIFNDTMTYVVFSPYWNVPSTIAENETLPSIMKDPAFLDRNNMEVVDTQGRPVDPATIDLEDPAAYRFRQRPGAGNSLGLVKFMFPNQFSVYLHDTPADSLFERATRSFSHGCVRVERPNALAEYLLRDRPEWTSERIAQAMHAGEERRVDLKDPVPVYLGYWTAAASPEGVEFRSDVYGIDARQADRLAARLARLRKSTAAGDAAEPKKPAKAGSSD